MNATIQGYLDACHEAEETVEDIQYSIARVKRELTALESKLVGARVNERIAKDILSKAASQEVIVEVTHRERDIAHMKGIVLNVGDTITPEAMQTLFDAPVLERFSKESID